MPAAQQVAYKLRDRPAGPLAALRHYEEVLARHAPAATVAVTAETGGGGGGGSDGKGDGEVAGRVDRQEADEGQQQNYPLVADVRSIRYLQDGSLTAKVFSLAPAERHFVAVDSGRLQQLLARWGLGFPPPVRETYVLLLDPHVHLPDDGSELSKRG